MAEGNGTGGIGADVISVKSTDNEEHCGGYPRMYIGKVVSSIRSSLFTLMPPKLTHYIKSQSYCGPIDQDAIHYIYLFSNIFFIMKAKANQ